MLLPKPPPNLTQSLRTKWYKEHKKAKARARAKKSYRNSKRKAEEAELEEPPIIDPEPEAFDKNDVENFYEGNRKQKHRDIKKLKASLPTDSLRATAAMNAYLTQNVKSPVRQTLQNIGVVNSGETLKEHAINAQIVTNLKDVVTDHKGDTTTEGCVLRNVISASVVSSEPKRGEKSNISKTLNINRARLTKGVNLRKKMDKPGWLVTKRKTENMGLKPEHIQLAFDYWQSSEASRATGNKRDIKRKRVAPKKYESHQIQIMEKTETEIYTCFMEKNPAVKMCFTSFLKCKPYFVRPARPQDRQTCCCKTHVETRTLFRLCMLFRKNSGVDTDKYPIFVTLKELVESTLCPKAPGEKYHNQKCLRRECQECGMKNFKLSSEEQSDVGTENWERFEYVEVNGKRKQMLVKKQTSPHEMFNYFYKLVEEFPFHEFQVSWQSSQLRSLQKNLPKNHTLCINDFSENARCKLQQETQSVYFAGHEISLHVTLLYRHLSQGNYMSIFLYESHSKGSGTLSMPKCP